MQNTNDYPQITQLFSKADKDGIIMITKTHVWSVLRKNLRLCHTKKAHCREIINNYAIIEPRSEKTNVLHMGKQRRRSASR